MKVLVVSTVTFELNGITSVIMNYYRKIDKHNMQIDFIAIDDVNEGYRNEIESNGSKIFCLPRKSNPLKYQLMLRRILKENKYDVIHVHGNSSLMIIETIVAKISRVPVRIVHSHNTTCSHKVLHKVLNPILKVTCNHGFACGQEAGRWLFNNNNFEVIKNGIDLNKFRYDENIREEFREKINARNRKVIGHVGNFVYQKNHDFLIDAYNELVKNDKNYLLLLIGEGDTEIEIKEKVESLGISQNVLFLGKTTEVGKYLQAMDLFILPSHFEGLPVVLIESQASGLQCIVSDKVTEEANLTGTLTFLPINNPLVWANKIIELDINNRIHNCNDAYERINDAGYNVEKNAYKMKSLYENYLKGSR